MATDEAEVAAVTEEKKGGGLLKTIGMGVGLFILVMAAQFVTSIVGCLVMPGLMPGCTTHVAEEKPKGAAKGTKKAAEPKPPPVYLALDPPLVVSLPEQNTMHFLQATVEVMARDEQSINAVKTHMPVIRNNLLNTLSGKTMAELTSPEGKEALRKACLVEVQRVLKANTTKDEKTTVEDLYFTSFVVQ